MTKSLAGLLFLTAGVWAADFTNGQAARVVIGQRTFTAQDPGGTPSANVVGAVSGLAYANDTLFVADSNRVGAAPYNHRVLVYTNLSSKLPAPTDALEFTSRCPVCTGTADIVLGQTAFDKNDLQAASQTTLRLPTAVATDGRILAVADTDNNRVLIWKSLPTVSQQPADIVLGQPDFKTTVVNEGRSNIPTNRSFRGPQGVWIQAGRLFVADTQNHRVLIWNSIPTTNFQPANVVLGQVDFQSATQPDLTKATVEAKATNMLNPVSVTSDGVRLLVADLGHNRVLMWNSIPTQNTTAADLVLGQLDMTTADANNTKALCESNGTDSDGNATYPARCGATLNFPRYALTDGTRLFIADGGNDRVLVYNSLPVTNGQPADIVLGQIDPALNQNSDSAAPLLRSSADSVRTPMSLAWDGTNLYVSDPFNRRIMVFTVGQTTLLYTAVRNSASRNIYAVGTITFAGEIQEGDEITIKIGTGDLSLTTNTDFKEYKYKVLKADTFDSVVGTFVAKINDGAGDPLVFATANLTLAQILLTARASGDAGDAVSMTATVSDTATITATTSGAALEGGQDAAKIAPGTLVTILGENLSDNSASADLGRDDLPLQLAGTQVYFDGIRAPLLSVSPDQINAQVPWEVLDSTSINAYVRTVRNDGRITVTTAVAVPVIPQNPGIFADPGEDPRPAVALHYSSRSTGTISVDGTATAGDTATVTIEDRSYSYTVQDGDTLESIRNALVNLINDQDDRVEAYRSGLFTRIRLRARVDGPEGNGIEYSASANDSNQSGAAQVVMTATTGALCCANVAGSRVTPDNPALPGETIVVYATGLGLVVPQEARDALATGLKYNGVYYNTPSEFVSSLAGGKTANVLYSGYRVGSVGLYEVHLELNSDLPTNPLTQLTIAQDVYVSNIVIFPVKNPLDQNQAVVSP